MKQFVLVFSLLLSYISFSQNVIHQKIVDVPRLGNQGVFMLDWYKTNDGLRLFVYGHQDGSLVEKTNEEIEAIKKANAEKLEGKKLVGRVLTSIFNSESLRSGDFAHRALLLNIIDLDDELTTADSKTYLVDHSTNTNKSIKSYFKPKDGGMVDAGNFFNKGIGKETSFSMLDFEKRYPKIKMNTIIPSVHFADIRNKSTFSIEKCLNEFYVKNKYDPTQKGFEMETADEQLFCFENMSIFDGLEILEDSFNYNDINDNQFYAFFKNESNFNQLQHIVFNKEGTEVKTTTFDYTVPQKFYGHFYIQNLFNEDNQKEINFFGFDYKKDKKLKGEQTLIYKAFISSKGEIEKEITFNYGTLKKFKRVFKPVYVFQKENSSNLIIINANTKNSLLDVFELSEDGTITTINQQKLYSYFNFDEIKAIVNNSNNYEKKGRLNNSNYFIYNAVKKEYINDLNSRVGLQNEVEMYNGFYIFSVNQSLELNKKLISLPPSNEPIKFTSIEKTEDLDVYYVRQGVNSWLLKVSSDSKYEFDPINLGDALKVYEPKTRFSSYRKGQQIIVDEDKKIFYVIHQYYNKELLIYKLLEKITVSVIKY